MKLYSSVPSLLQPHTLLTKDCKFNCGIRDKCNPKLSAGTLLQDLALQREVLGILIDASPTNVDDLPCNCQRHVIFLPQKIA